MPEKYPIKTKRLGLRLLMTSDIDCLDVLESDPEVKQYFPDGARDRAKTEDMIKRFITAFEEHGLPCFLLFDLESGESRPYKVSGNNIFKKGKNNEQI